MTDVDRGFGLPMSAPDGLEGRCCELHRVGTSPLVCCDPEDCGPCCERCPTCPTVRLRTGRAELAAQADARTVLERLIVTANNQTKRAEEAVTAQAATIATLREALEQEHAWKKRTRWNQWNQICEPDCPTCALLGRHHQTRAIC